MKTIFTLIFVFFLIPAVYTQEAPETEIIFLTQGASSSNQITKFEVNPISYQGVSTNVYRYSFTGCNVGIKHTSATVTLRGNVWCAESGLEYIFYNENWQGGTACNNSSEYKPFANGLYEIKISVDGVEKFKFYLDTRHNSLPNGCDDDCLGNDISIVYRIDSNLVKGSNGFPNQESEIKPINEGGYYTWWYLRDNNCSNAFSKFNNHLMPILQTPTVQNSSPLLQWQKAQRSDAQSIFYMYVLQRSINGGAFNTIYQTTNFNQTSYLDYEIFWNPSQTSTKIDYRLFAIYEDEANVLIDVSNYQTIETSEWYLMKRANNFIPEKTILHNYPNPFNNQTSIYYTIKNDSQVYISIYDLLGREILVLVNEKQQAGQYSIEFDATELSSGVYLSVLKTGNKLFVNKMVLSK